ncbi:hypothetical protein ACFLZ0_02560, partial [Patescibacteria group bacterium]
MIGINFIEKSILQNYRKLSPSGGEIFCQVTIGYKNKNSFLPMLSGKGMFEEENIIFHFRNFINKFFSFNMCSGKILLIVKLAVIYEM